MNRLGIWGYHCPGLISERSHKLLQFVRKKEEERRGKMAEQ